MAWTGLANFDATKPEVKVMADKVFRDHFNDQKYAETAILRAVTQKQTVNMTEIIKNGRCAGVSVYSLYNNGVVTASNDAAVTCDISGNPILPKVEDYANNIDVSAKFFIADDDCPDMVSAKNKYTQSMKFAMQSILQELAKKIGPKLVLNADVNASPTDVDDAAVNAGNLCNIPAAAFETSETIGKMYYNAQRHSFGNDLIMVNGKNFFVTDFLNSYRRDGCCDVDSVFAGNAFDYVFDVQNVAVADFEKTVVFRNGAIFMFSNNRWQNNSPMDKPNDVKVWRMKVPDFQIMNNGSMQDVYVDVKQQYKCTGADVFGMHYEVRFLGGLHTGDTMDDGTLGILAYGKSA